MNTSLRIGWIGTGVMGHSMASHLQKAGYPLTVYNRTKSKAAALLEEGKCSLADVAYRSGFSSPQYFNRVFKQLTGMTPKNYGGEITKKSHTNV